MPTAFDIDLDTLRVWWAAHVASVGDDVRGLWFGLTCLVSNDGATRHTMYVAGTPHFDSQDGGEWACDYVWEPADRYLVLDGLGSVGRRDWQSVLEHAVALVLRLQPWIAVPALRGVGVGFDDGDVVVVWAAGD